RRRPQCRAVAGGVRDALQGSRHRPCTHPDGSRRMMFDPPKYHQLGDCIVAVSFSDTVSLSANFRIHAIADAIAEAPATGLVEAVPHIRTLGIVFDRMLTTADHIIGYLAEMVEAT